jgi:TolB-like protein/Tfp pilus assembly protein PilF
MVRQLTAIMFTDMVGYTALMQENEHQAMANRDRHRQILEASISEHGGRILQFYGDGTLSVFQSAIGAVHCAIQIQSALRSTDPPIPLRIGVHTGDVVHDQDGVFGDGVNVAARIEGLGVAGSVLISGKVHDEVKNQPDIRTRGLGEFNLKNVQRPMKVHAVVNDGMVTPDEAAVRPSRAGSGRSIAVLPFVNMSSDPENEFFSDGITEEIINALTRVNGLRVTARTSSFAFKNHNEDIRGIAEQLGVTHILEGSVRKAGNQVRVTAQLICARDGYHLFSEVYDRGLEDIFAVQDEISLAIVEELASHLGRVNVSGGEQDEHLVHRHSHDSEAYAEYLRGRFEWAHWSPEGARNAIERYRRSAEMDPSCELPYAGLSTAYVFLGALGHLPAEDAFGEAEQAAQRALELEESSGEAHVAIGLVRLFQHRDWEGAYRSLQKALSLNPGSADAHQVYGMYLRALGEVEEAVEEFRTASELDPLSHPIRQSLGEGLLFAGQMDGAQEVLEGVLSEDPNFRAATETLGWTRFSMGDGEGALALFESIPAKAGHLFAAAAARGYVYARLGRTTEARAMLELLQERGASDPDVTLSIDFALVHQGLGELDEAFHHLNEAIDRRLGAVVFLAGNPVWKTEIRADPRFDALLERIGHPTMVPAKTP